MFIPNDFNKKLVWDKKCKIDPKLFGMASIFPKYEVIKKMDKGD
jgi:hypothetical protein